MNPKKIEEIRNFLKEELKHNLIESEGISPKNYRWVNDLFKFNLFLLVGEMLVTLVVKVIGFLTNEELQLYQRFYNNIILVILCISMVCLIPTLCTIKKQICLVLKNPRHLSPKLFFKSSLEKLKKYFSLIGESRKSFRSAIDLIFINAESDLVIIEYLRNQSLEDLKYTHLQIVYERNAFEVRKKMFLGEFSTTSFLRLVIKYSGAFLVSLYTSDLLNKKPPNIKFIDVEVFVFATTILLIFIFWNLNEPEWSRVILERGQLLFELVISEKENEQSSLTT